MKGAQYPGIALFEKDNTLVWRCCEFKCNSCLQPCDVHKTSCYIHRVIQGTHLRRGNRRGVVSREAWKITTCKPLAPLNLSSCIWAMPRSWPAVACSASSRHCCLALLDLTSSAEEICRQVRCSTASRALLSPSRVPSITHGPPCKDRVASRRAVPHRRSSGERFRSGRFLSARDASLRIASSLRRLAQAKMAVAVMRWCVCARPPCGKSPMKGRGACKTQRDTYV